MKRTLSAFVLALLVLPGSALALPDFDGDNRVGFSDFLLFASAFGAAEGEPDYRADYDLDGSGRIDFEDFLVFVASFGQKAEEKPYEEMPAVTPDPLPQGHEGLAHGYPGDADIAADSAVVFAESFEGFSSANDLSTRWESVSNPELMSFAGDVPSGSSGSKSLLVTHVGGDSNGGHLYRRLDDGYDRLYFRFYVKFDPDCSAIHHFVHMGGYNPATPWPQGGAGTRPVGNDRFSTGIEPFGSNWVWDFYAYWMRMRGSPPSGQTWGNSFLRDTAPAIPRGQWQCVEVMMKVNDVGDSNGELALWIDGDLKSHLGKGFPMGKWIYDKFNPGQGGYSVYWSDEQNRSIDYSVPEGGIPFEGFRWRGVPELNINFFWLLVYITGAADGQVSRVWFDDIVIATEYVGPILANQ